MELDEPPSCAEVKKAIAQLKSCKAQGIDGIPAEAYKEGRDILLNNLTDLLSARWEKGTVPQDFQDAVSFPVQEQRRKGRLLQLQRHHPIVYRWQNLGQGASEQAHPIHCRRKSPGKPVWFQTKQGHYRHDIRARRDPGEMYGAEHGPVCCVN